MEPVTANPDLVAFCGLYCGACRAYRKGSCPGCRKNEKASWCKVRACCLASGYATCAACTGFDDVATCRKYTNFISRFSGLIFRSDRRACICRIGEIGPEAFATEMAQSGRQTIRP